MARRQEVLLRSTASFAPVLVQQHADQQGQRVTAEQLVGGVVLTEVEGRHAGDPVRPRAGLDPPVRAVVTRVSEASVTVDGEVVGAIGAGLLALVGVGRDDDADRARALGKKLHELRIFPSDDGARSVGDLGLPVLVVSQFTLYGDTRKGRRPSWIDAAPGELAEPLVDEVVAELRRRGTVVSTGRFGARMSVASVNEGPMTLQLEV
jgi:D-tyrosyl-tRNA(Tyr) deacylase